MRLPAKIVYFNGYDYLIVFHLLIPFDSSTTTIENITESEYPFYMEDCSLILDIYRLENNKLNFVGTLYDNYFHYFCIDNEKLEKYIEKISNETENYTLIE